MWVVVYFFVFGIGVFWYLFFGVEDGVWFFCGFLSVLIVEDGVLCVCFV